jgi:hypothetical protein
MSKTRIFFNLFGVCCLLLSVSHAVHFVSPLLRISSAAELPENGDDITPLQFIDLIQYYQNYEWETYDQADFEEWLYMPATYPADEYTLNQSEGDPIPPFYGYDWTNYDPTDFPNWLCMPDTLPATFNATNATYINQFIFENICPEFLEELENTFVPDENPLTMIISPFIFIYEMIYAVILFAISVIALILAKSFE